MILWALVTDLHVNSTVALCPPRVTRDDGGIYIASREQAYILECWIDFWCRVDRRRRETGAKTIGAVLGETVDLNWHTHTQLVEYDNRAILVDMAEEVLSYAGAACDVMAILRGTEAHSGGLGQLDELVAKRIGARGPKPDRFSYWHLAAEAEGVRLDMAHHPQTTGRQPNTRDAAAARHAWLTWTEYCEEGEQPPNVVARGHAHYWGRGWKGDQTECFLLPSWQLSTAFGYRRGAGRKMEPFRGVILECESGTYRAEVVKYQAPRGQIWHI